MLNHYLYDTAQQNSLYGFFRLLGYYTSYGGLKRTFRHYLSAPPLRDSLKVEQIGSPETFVSNHLTPRNTPEEEKIQFNRGGSLQFLIRVVEFSKNPFLF